MCLFVLEANLRLDKQTLTPISPPPNGHQNSCGDTEYGDFLDIHGRVSWVNGRLQLDMKC